MGGDLLRWNARASDCVGHFLIFSTFISQLGKDAFLDHFQTHGKVEKLHVLVNRNYTSGFVCYKSLISASKAMKQPHCRIAGQNVRVSAADSWHQPDSTDEHSKIETKPERKERQSTRTLNDQSTSGAGCSRQMDPIANECVATASSTTLVNLNDDCLCEILSYLDVIDLCAINEIPELHRLAQQVFRVHYTTLDLSHASTIVNYYDLTLHKLRNLLRCFGTLIVGLKVSANAFQVEKRPRVVDLIVRHCPNVTSLELIDFHFRNVHMFPIQTFFGNLHELTLTHCNFQSCSRHLFRECARLKSMTIHNDTNVNGICLELEFPQMESMTLSMGDHITAHNLETFFRLNGQLKSLELARCDDATFTVIAETLPQLECLSLEISYFFDYVENVKSLLQLNHLKELKLNCSLYPISTFIDALADHGIIEVLHISEGVLNDHLIEALCKCKRLRSLKLCSMPNLHDKFLIALAKNLPNLTEFSIRRCQAMSNSGVLALVEIATRLNSLSIINATVQVNDGFYMELVRIYLMRPQKLTLNLLQAHSDLTSTLINEHKHIVHIEQITDCGAFDDDLSNSDGREYYYDFEYDDDDMPSDWDDVELFELMNDGWIDELPGYEGW